MIWMFFGILFGYLSAVRAGGLLDRLLTGRRRRRHLDPGLLLARVLIYFLTYKIELFPTGGYVPLTEDPAEWADHLILPWFTLAVALRRLLQPRAALEHARRDGRGLRAHRAGEGPERAAG